MMKLSQKEQELWSEIKAILWKEWDPIGVYDPHSDWDDEYNSYVPYIFRLAIEGSDYVKISSSLTSTRKQNMGLSPSNSREHDIEIAKLIVAAKQDIIGA